MKTVSVYLAIVLLSINSAKSEPPTLSQSEEVTLEKNQTFRIQCTSNVPVRWMNSVESQYMDSNDVHTFHSTYFTLPDGSYGSEMVLESVKHGSVGYYYCIKNITYEEDDEFLDKPELLEKLVDDEEASRIYVFVRDFDNLIAPIGLPIIYVNRNEDTIVPCKPTSKETTVELVGTQSEIMSSDETSRMYDPKKGFVINIDRVEKAGDYKCKPKYPSVTNKDECLDFMVELTNLSPPTDQIHAPTISSESDGHAVIGNTFTFECSIEYDANIYIKMEWILPKHVSMNDNRIEVMDPRAERSDIVGKKKAISELIIRNVRKNDEGIYKCRVQDNGNSENHDKQLLKVLEEGENYIEMKPLAGVQTTEYALIPGEVFQMAVDWKSFPKVPRDHITWLKDGKEIRNNSNYDILILDKTILLKIRKASYKEAGIYTLALNNTLQRKEMNFTFLVEGKPEVHLADQFVIEGEEAIVDCTVLSTAEPYIAWEYKKCRLNPWPTCSSYQKNINITSSEKLATKNRLETIIRMKFTPDEPGFIKCSAQNNIGVSHKVAELLISDIPKPFSLEGYDNTERIAIGDELILKCSVLLYNQFSDISWLKDDFPVRRSDSILIENVDTKYSHQSILRIPSITSKDNGVYKCQAGDQEDPKMLYIEAVPAEPLTWDPQSTPDGRTLDMKLADSLELNCKASGLPVPKATWFKDGIEILNDDENYSFSNNEYNQILTLKKFVRPEDDGRYKCVLSNRLEQIEKNFKINVVGIKLKTGWIFVILGLILGLILAIIYLAIKIKRKNRELKKAGLYKFAEGNIEHYNPALDLDEQAELLPYDNNYEFPRESLKLGKQLGAGAFGVVVEAIAKKIKPTEEETKVAVKMVKRTADNEVIMALVSELKIMIHMGQHLNVVNLLGAVTKKIAKREIMIIVEYCEYGNVQNLLMKNRKYFINQINPETDKIDSSIMEKRTSASEYESNIATRSDNEPRSGTRAGRPNSRGYIRQSDLYDSNIDSCNTEQTIMTTIPEGDGSAVMSNNSVQPAWRSNYKPQNTDPIALTTTDLVSWAYQVAKGMEYLSSKKVLHGDLAARNILLCENNVVKICDFGLARSMYKGDNYKKQGEARLPIKWLALESLESQVFSTYTDVWSFGIVLWEFFSLAKVPYPGMDVHPNFLNKLKDGYRMEKPTYANQELYDIMLACWHVRPESRPLFNELGNRFGAFLEEDVTNHYMQLNEPYMSFNDEYLSKRELDLNILRPPEKMAPKAPIYVNGNINRYDIPQIRIDRGSNDNYLQMNANITQEDEGIFSPTRHSDEVFNYPSLKKVKPEEIPMLSRRTQRFSDSEGEHSPDADSRSRGFHELNHSISSTDDNQDNDYLESKSYLGMNGGTRDAFSNPSYQMLKTVNEK